MEREKFLEEILPFISKPARYIGNEYNVPQKKCDQVELKVVLAYPDIYEVGMSYLGLKILYHLLNEKPNILAERVFAPWLDMEKIMRERKIPLFSLETATPIKNFDIIGFSITHELVYTNVLNMLDLAQIPLLSKNRENLLPLIIAGGPATLSPEPFADFFDAIVIGDGEEIILEIVNLMLEAKKNKIGKIELLHSLGKIEGIYIPSFFEPKYKEDGEFIELESKVHFVNSNIKVKKRTVDLEKAPYPTKQLVPYIEIVHDHIALEIQRGCPRRCKFCLVGYTYGPSRERKVENLLNLAKETIRHTGLEEISLLSLSACDYSKIEELISKLVIFLSPLKISVSLPSLRIDSFSLKIAKELQKIRKTGLLTFAPEAGTERLRKVINKPLKNELFTEVIAELLKSGWQSLKLYFMIGLPTETETDLVGIVELLSIVNTLIKKYSKFSKAHANVSISSFVPKPHTPFQWVSFLPITEIVNRIKFIKKRVKGLSFINLKWQNPEQSYLEAVFARGDRRLSKVLLAAFSMGAKFDNWSECFNFELWKKAFQEVKIDPDFYATRERKLEEKFPWDHIDVGISKEILKKEYLTALYYAKNV